MALADPLHLPERDEQDLDIVIGAVKRWPATHKDRLIIVDNADNLKAVANFLSMRSRSTRESNKRY